MRKAPQFFILSISGLMLFCSCSYPQNTIKQTEKRDTLFSVPFAFQEYAIQYIHPDSIEMMDSLMQLDLYETLFQTIVNEDSRYIGCYRDSLKQNQYLLQFSADTNVHPFNGIYLMDGIGILGRLLHNRIPVYTIFRFYNDTIQQIEFRIASVVNSGLFRDHSLSAPESDLSYKKLSLSLETSEDMDFKENSYIHESKALTILGKENQCHLYALAVNIFKAISKNQEILYDATSSDGPHHYWVIASKENYMIFLENKDKDYTAYHIDLCNFGYPLMGIASTPFFEHNITDLFKQK